MMRLVALLLLVLLSACEGNLRSSVYAPLNAPHARGITQLVYQDAFVSAVVKPVPQSEEANLGTYALLQTPNEMYALAPATDYGSFSTFHVAVDAQGRAWGVKRLTRPEKDASPFFVASTEDEVRQEFGVTEHVLRDRLKVHTIAQSDDAVFVVLPLWSGSLSQFHGSHPNTTWLLRATLAQVSRDAARLHQAGYIHHDIRSANILWNQTGDIVLWDFGLAQPTLADGTLERVSFGVHRRFGRGTRVNRTMMAPEVDAGAYTDKTDTWSLGLTMLELFTAEEDDLLFLEGLGDIVAYPQSYARWYDSLARSPMDTISCDGIAHPDSAIGKLQHWNFAAMYHTLNKHDPQLCNLLLGGMLVPNPQQRWDMARVAAYANRWMSEEETQNVASNLAAAAAENTSRKATVESLQDFMACARHCRDDAACACEAPELPSFDD